MLVSRLFRSLLRFLSPGIVPEGGGGGEPTPPTPEPTPAPAPDLTLTPEPPAPTPAPSPAPAEPEDPFKALTGALDKLTEPAKPEPTPAPSPAPTAAPAPGATPAPAPKAADVDLTPPDGMGERAQGRWAQLAERAKLVPELERRATEVTAQLQSVRELVNSSGLNANEFTDMMEMGRLTKSQSPQDLQKALTHIDGMRAQLAQRLGVELPGFDPLAAHPDLKSDVESMTLTKERALELAQLRGKGQQHDAVTAEQREMATFQNTVRNAAATMENTLKQRAGTPGHEQKLGFIHSHFAKPENLQAFVKTYQPEQWPAAMLLMYDAYTPQQAAAAPPPPGPQPLRPGSRAIGSPVNTGPVTAESAVDRAFAAAGL